MSEQYFTITAQSGLIFSEQAGTVDTHKTCDYIPGSALWGALAAQWYRQQGRDNPDLQALAWQLWHSDAVTLSNAYISAVQGVTPQRLLPVPRMWQQNKHAPDKRSVFNMLRYQPPSDGSFQRLPCPLTYIASKTHQAISELDTPIVPYQHVIRDFSVKAGIDFATKTAEEGKLYSYQFIAPEQTFIGKLTFSDTLGVSERSAIVELLVNTRFLGKSRASEFGQVRVSLIDAPEPVSVTDASSAQPTVIWCISDMLLPNSFETHALFGYERNHALQQASINWEQSYVSRRKIRPFNQKRGGFDSEQTLIQKGSVIVLNASLSSQDCAAIMAKGIGMDLCKGHGEVVVNPSWVDQTELVLQAIPQQASQMTLSDIPVSPLVSLLRERQYDNTQPDIPYCAVLAIVNFYKQARRHHNINANAPFGPSKSQWSDVLSELQTQPLSTLVNDERFMRLQNNQSSWAMQRDDSTNFRSFVTELMYAFDGTERTQKDKTLHLIKYLLQHNLTQYVVLRYLEQHLQTHSDQQAS